MNCAQSLREDVKKSITVFSAKNSKRGTYHFTAEIKCRCGWVNKVPVIFDKK